MSEIIDTKNGQFRRVTDGKTHWFLWECPHCHEMLPLDDAHFAGEKPVDHQSATAPSTYCTFRGTRTFGADLVAAIQASILLGFKASHDEGEDWMGRKL